MGVVVVLAAIKRGGKKCIAYGMIWLFGVRGPLYGMKIWWLSVLSYTTRIHYCNGQISIYPTYSCANINSDRYKCRGPCLFQWNKTVFVANAVSRLTNGYFIWHVWTQIPAAYELEIRLSTICWPLFSDLQIKSTWHALVFGKKGRQDESKFERIPIPYVKGKYR